MIRDKTCLRAVILLSTMLVFELGHSILKNTTYSRDMPWQLFSDLMQMQMTRANINIPFLCFTMVMHFLCNRQCQTKKKGNIYFMQETLLMIFRLSADP